MLVVAEHWGRCVPVAVLVKKKKKIIRGWGGREGLEGQVRGVAHAAEAFVLMR